MAIREFTQDESRSLYFARLDAKRDTIAYHKTTQKNLQTLKQERDQEKARADKAEARARQAEDARKRMEDLLRKMGLDPDQI